jgi:hypothetical protein
MLQSTTLHRIIAHCTSDTAKRQRHRSNSSLLQRMVRICVKINPLLQLHAHAQRCIRGQDVRRTFIINVIAGNALSSHTLVPNRFNPNLNE